MFNATAAVKTGWGGPTYGANFVFEQFSDHGDQAVFRFSCPYGRDADALFEALKDQELLHKVLKTKCHEVRIRKRVNEVSMPDLLVDDKERTVALDWRQLFSHFFAEERNQVRCREGRSCLYEVEILRPARVKIATGFHL